MKMTTMKTYLANYRSLFLTLLILCGPVFSDALPVDSIPEDGLAQSQTIPLLDDDYDIFTKSLPDLPTYQYPYDYLPSLLASQGKQSINLFVYGSLMDCMSASRTLHPNTLKTRKLAKAYGVKTIYNRSVPYTATPHWGEPEVPYATAMLNTVVTGDTQDIALGVLLDIPLDEIPALLSREVGYDLKPVIVQDWVDSNQNVASDQRAESYSFAYILSSPTPSQYTSDRLLPREGYYQRVMEAARSNGSVFFQQWLNNTFLADGVTTVSHYELDKDKVAIEFCTSGCPQTTLFANEPTEKNECPAHW